MRIRHLKWVRWTVVAEAWFDEEFFDDTSINKHAVAPRTIAEAQVCFFDEHSHTASEVAVSVWKKSDFFDILMFAPLKHRERIVDRKTDNLVNTERFKGVVRGFIPRKMGRRARWCKGARKREEHDFFSIEKLFRRHILPTEGVWSFNLFITDTGFKGNARYASSFWKWLLHKEKCYICYDVIHVPLVVPNRDSLVNETVLTSLAGVWVLPHTQKHMSSLPRWTLADLYTSPTDPALAQAFILAREQTDHLVTTYKDKLEHATDAEIGVLLERYEAVLQVLAKPVDYASLRYLQQTNDPEREGFSRVMREKALAIERDLLWVELSLGKLEEGRLTTLLAAPEVQRYKHVIERILAAKPHQLSEVEEQLVNDLQQTAAEAFVQLFEQENSNKRFAYRDEDRTMTDLLVELSSVQRETREQAASAISNGLEEEGSRRAFIYNTIIKNKEILDRYRKFSTPEASRHLSNETTHEAVRSLTEAVEGRVGLFQEYYRWKGKKLGISDLADYDRYAPLDDVEKTYTFDEARDIVLKSFAAFSPIFAEKAQAFFDNGWIDADPTPGKRGGAFCSYVTADHHPYVFLNYQGRIGDVLTLAHELGHAIHATLAAKNGYLQFHTPLTLAETASVFAEMLTFDYLRKELANRPRDLEALCAKKIESVFATVFRQVSMHRFEQVAHAHVRTHGFATPAAFHDLWKSSQAKLFGNALRVTPGYRVWWSYVSHFFAYPFYVYAYAYGELLTFCLYKRAKSGDMPDFTDRYIDFLSKGSTAEPKELLAPLGINPESVATWNEGLDWIQELVQKTTTS